HNYNKNWYLFIEWADAHRNFSYVILHCFLIKNPEFERLAVTGSRRQGCNGYRLFNQRPVNGTLLIPAYGPSLNGQTMESFVGHFARFNIRSEIGNSLHGIVCMQ